MAGISLQLRYDVAGFEADTITCTDATFQFLNVPFNPCELRVEAQGFRPVRQRIDVRSTVPQELQISQGPGHRGLARVGRSGSPRPPASPRTRTGGTTSRATTVKASS